VRLSLTACLAAAAVLAGCGAAKPPDTSLSAHGDRSESVIGEAVHISGTVSRGHPAPMNLDLLASTAPLYGDTRRVGRTRSDSHGQYGFVVRPRINTAYTVATTGAEKHVVVFVAPRYRLKYTRAGTGAIRIVFTVDHPPELHPSVQPVYFYAAPKGVGELIRLGQGDLTRRTDVRAVAAATLLGAPQGPVDVFACLAEMIAPGYGSPPIKGCGQARLAR
jgi:hypothetical protein